MQPVSVLRYNFDILDRNSSLTRRAFRDVRICFAKKLEKWYNQHVIRVNSYKRHTDLRRKHSIYPDWPRNVTLEVLTKYFEAQKELDDKLLNINKYYRQILNSLTSKVERFLFPYFVNYVEKAVIEKYKT